jgi:hypothetical protein
MRHTRSPSGLFWVEAALSGVTGLVLVLTLVTRDWIEVVFGVDPDGGDGTLEWLLVAGLTVVFGVSYFSARAQWRRSPAAASSSRP